MVEPDSGFQRASPAQTTRGMRAIREKRGAKPAALRPIDFSLELNYLWHDYRSGRRIGMPKPSGPAEGAGHFPKRKNVLTGQYELFAAS
jgi:hypothetical protein